MTTTMLPPVEDTLQEIQTSGVPEDSSHFVPVPPGEDDQTPQAYVLRASIEGFPVTAICGHVFTPGRDTRNKPVCKACKDLYDADPLGHGDRDEIPEA